MRVTLKQVAAQAGVSYQTVSKVLNGQANVSKDTEERIWQVVRSLGYRPHYTARSLRSRRSYTIGYSWAPNPPDKISPVLDQLLQSMLSAAERCGYYLLSFPYQSESQDRIAPYRELIDTGRVDGFVLSSVEYNDPRIIFLQERDFPFVAFGRSNLDNFMFVDVDGGAGLAEATHHLISLGHRKIAVIAWDEGSRVGNDRLAGFFEAMTAAGITVRPEWIIRGENDYIFGYEATNRLIHLPESIRPTAIVSLNDSMAIGSMQAIHQSGLRVGNDVAVTGFDDIPLVEHLTPSLTSIRQPVWEVGQLVIDRLVSFLETQQMPDPRGILLKPELVVRASSLPLAAVTAP